MPIEDNNFYWNFPSIGGQAMQQSSRENKISKLALIDFVKECESSDELDAGETVCSYFTDNSRAYDC